MTRAGASRGVTGLALLVTLAGCAGPERGGNMTAIAVDSLIDAGEARFAEADYDAARALWREGLAAGGAGSDREHRLLAWMAWADLNQGDYEQARVLADSALALERGLGGSGDPFTLNVLGVLAWYEGRLADAERWLQDAQAGARLQGDRSLLARTSNNLGLVYNEYAEFGQARAAFTELSDAGRELGVARFEAAALSNLGMVDVWSGNPRLAVTSLLEARSRYADLDFPADEQNTLGQLGTAYLALGDFQSALLALDSALAISRRHGLRQEEASNLEWLAELYRQMGDPQRALQLLSRAAELDEELGLLVESGSVLYRQAGILSSLGHPDDARGKAEDARARHERAGARYDELLDLLLLAELRDAEGETRSADDLLRQATSLSDELGARGGRVQTALTTARLADRRRDAPAALGALDGALQELDATELSTAWEVHALRARALVRVGRDDEAVETGREAIRALERARGRPGAPELRSTYAPDQRQVYADLSQVLLGLGRVDEAFEIVDQARGRGLIENLAAVRGDGSMLVQELAAGEGLLREIDKLVGGLSEIDRIPASERGAVEVSTARDLGDRLSEARSEYEAFLLRVAGWGGADPELLAARPVSAERVRDALRTEEVLLEYAALRDRLLVFAVTHDGVQVVESPVSEEELTTRVLFARDLMASPASAPEDARTVLEGLHRLLIEPVVRSGVLDRSTNVIVVPSGALAYLPFGALIDPDTGRYLVEDRILTQLPSASTLPALRERARPSATEERTTVFVPFPDRLPATAVEGEGIRQRAPETVVRRGRRASEAELRRALGEEGIVHVATHGILNTVNPLFSRLELAPGRSGGPTDDGRLEVHELLGLEVRSRLVFLSGCETALGPGWSGEFAKGEDYATLARAFLYAGASGVIATLWRIEDEGGAAFADRFYAHLASAPPAEALALAQRDLMKDSRWSAPYVWAGYVLSADGSTG